MLHSSTNVISCSKFTANGLVQCLLKACSTSGYQSSSETLHLLQLHLSRSALEFIYAHSFNTNTSYMFKAAAVFVADLVHQDQHCIFF